MRDEDEFNPWMDALLATTKQLEQMRAERDAAIRERDEARRERDEARREVCNNEAEHIPTMADSHMEAKRRGWDCFKEDA